MDEAFPEAVVEVSTPEMNSESSVPPSVVKTPEKSPTKQNIAAEKPKVLSEASLIASAHEVEGKVLLIQNGPRQMVRFENLKTINGPDLRIYLATDLKATDIVDLGRIKATEGNVNYTIPNGTDTQKYRNVLIWCRAFSVLFSSAEFAL